MQLVLSHQAAAYAAAAAPPPVPLRPSIVASARTPPHAVRLCALPDDHHPPLPRNLQRMTAALHSAADVKERSVRLMRLGERLPAAPMYAPRT